MIGGKKFKLKKRYFHPITSYLLLSLLKVSVMNLLKLKMHIPYGPEIGIYLSKGNHKCVREYIWGSS